MDKKEVDAGVVSKDFAYSHVSNFNVEETPIVFQPVLLYFAFPTESTIKKYLIERIDNDVKELKANRDSIYYQSLNKWLGINLTEKIVLPDWVKWTLIGIAILALLLGGGTFLLRVQVAKRTKELAADIVKREKTEKELRESEEKIRLILETIPIGLAVSDINGRILSVNKATIKISGYSEAELIGKKGHSFIVTKNRNRVKKFLDEQSLGIDQNYEFFCIGRTVASFLRDYPERLLKTQREILSAV